MKTMTFTIDEDIAEKMKQEDNKSALISNLLRKYYGEEYKGNLSKEEIECVLKKEELELEYLKKLEEFENGTI